MAVCSCRLVYFLLLTLTGVFSLLEQPLSAEKEDDFVQTPPEDIYDVSCSPPAAPDHGYVVGKNFTMGSRVTVHCMVGYRLVGPGVRTCLAVPDPFHHVAIWEPQTPATCVDTATIPSSPEEEPVVEEDFEEEPDSESPSQNFPAVPIGVQSSSQTTNAAQVPTPPEMEPVVEADTAQVQESETLSQNFPPFPRFGAIGLRRSPPKTGAHIPEHQQERCQLPLDTGRCGSGLPRFYFDHVIGECRHFQYGGCQGNDNNFLSLGDCLRACTGLQ